MVGASKINHETDDLDRLYEMFDMDLNNSHISRIYRTNSGKSLSRIHISQIRRGQRWNSDIRSFLMKNELGIDNSIKTEYKKVTYKSTVSQIISGTDVYHIYLTYVDGKPIFSSDITPLSKKPRTRDLIEYHTNFINEFNKQNRES